MTRPLAIPLRAAVALTCSLALVVPAGAHARAPAIAPIEGPLTDELNEQAAEHVTKAYQQHQSRAFASAEEEFQRAAFFAPRWRPLHFNLGVVAEAQGKLGAAINEYRAFRPFATPDEGMVVDQRIAELDARRRKVVGNHRRQIAVGAVAMALGLGMMAGGGVLTGLNYKKPIVDEDNPLDMSAEDKRKKRVTGGIVLAIYGLVVVGLAFLPLSRAVKSKRQLDGLALGRTRLQLTGGGATLRF